MTETDPKRSPDPGDLVVVLDCGSTNLRAIAVNANGEVVARSGDSNATLSDPDNDDWHYWDIEAIFEKLGRCAREVVAKIDPHRVRAVTVTTFGADGTFLDDDDQPMYPVISWKCTRTVESMAHMGRFIDPDRVVQISGVGHFSFNTLNKFIWFRENRPDLIDSARRFVFVSSLIVHRLTGRFALDATLVGTTQMTDIRTQDFSPEILDALGVRRALFPNLAFPGETIGSLNGNGTAHLGLPAGIPMISTGHDTQFAVFGAGASANRPVLSSGTWEILMAQTDQITLPDTANMADAFTCEWGVGRGQFNPGYQYIASAVIEWVGRVMFSELEGAARYETMISEAEAAPGDCYGLVLDPDLLVKKGAMSCLSLDVDRGAIFRAALEGLVRRLKTGLAALETAGGFRAEELTLVGGGTRNQFWTQMKANVLGIPVRTLEEPEVTVLGAAMVAFWGVGLFASADEARRHFDLATKITLPEG